MTTVRRLLLIGSLAACVGGCGYSSTTGDRTVGEYNWGSLYREDVSSVAVPIFRNTDFSRGDEFALTRALVQQIETRTPYKVLDRERADTILEGEVVSVGRGAMMQDPRAAIPQEQMYLVTVNFTWKNLRTGEILVNRRGFQQAVSMYPTLGESRAIGRNLAAEQLAAAIVNELSSDW
jgi:hypothetical protein